MHGAPGTPVRLRIVRPGRERPLLLTLVRQPVTVSAVSSRMLTAHGRRVLLVRIPTFIDHTASQVRQIVARAAAAQAAGRRDRRPPRRHRRRADRGRRRGSGADRPRRDRRHRRPARAARGVLGQRHARSRCGKVAVLIDFATASAAEIVAGALKAHGAIVTGSPSYGKGTVQAVRPLPGGGALKLTVASFTLAGDRIVNGRGVDADRRRAGSVLDPPRTRRWTRRWRRCAGERTRRSRRTRLAVVCEVGRRGRLLVAEPFFEFGVATDARPARSGGRVARATWSRSSRTGAAAARLIERLGRPDDVRAVLRGVAIEQGVGGAVAGGGRAGGHRARRRTPAEGVRVDLRDRVCFTVDPPDARDFDDAIGVEREDDGLRLFVHIADVSARVPAGSALDRGGRPARMLGLPAGHGRADAARAAVGRPLQPAARRRPPGGDGRDRAGRAR